MGYNMIYKFQNNLFLKRTMNIFIFIFCIFILALSVRGLPGNPNVNLLNQKEWRDDGPFELSPERGRFALVYSVAEDKTVKFSSEIAKFVVPDVGYINGGYVSLFAPSVSFIVLPGYILGKYFGLSQVGSFAVISFFAFLNFLLIRVIASRVGANSIAATVGGLVFLFATPAFSYAVTLYQHHISTFLILSSIYLLLRFNNVFSYFLVWTILAFSVTVDYPNFFMMIPIGTYSIYRFFSVTRINGYVKLNIFFTRAISVLGVVLPILLFFWFNNLSYGNPLQLSGTVPRATQIDKNGEPLYKDALDDYGKEVEESSESNGVAFSYFKNRNITQGMYTFFLSLDRGMLIFAPIILFGFIGFAFALRKKAPGTMLLISVLGFNVVLYSMWGDPWGGWAFGSRYLIPSYSILGIFIGLLLTYWRKRDFLLITFYVVLIYSICVNTMGALTSNANPPKNEAIALEKSFYLPQPYSFDRNIEYLDNGFSKAYAFGAFVKNYMSAWDFFALISLSLIYVQGILIMMLRLSANTEKTLQERSSYYV